MNLTACISILLSLVLLLPMSVNATDLIDRLDKKYKTAGYPETEVIARMTLTTEMREIDGSRLDDTFVQAFKIHRKLIFMMNKNGWEKSDQLLVDVIDAGNISLEPDSGMNLKFKKTLRLKAFLSPCDGAMEKYRGGSIDQFFQYKVIEKAERCFTHEERLQGKGYPYQ